MMYCTVVRYGTLYNIIQSVSRGKSTSGMAGESSHKIIGLSGSGQIAQIDENPDDRNILDKQLINLKSHNTKNLISTNKKGKKIV